jgi:hypothetical protein
MPATTIFIAQLLPGAIGEGRSARLVDLAAPPLAEAALGGRYPAAVR